MAEMKLAHRDLIGNNEEVVSSLLVWKTCRRQIFFFDDTENVSPQKFSQNFAGWELLEGSSAMAFLSEILCGLHSPLLGETEVFGQFKQWWQALPEELAWKKRFQKQMQELFSLVKNVREKYLCGQGSQSYGSLLRKKLEQISGVDILGAGHLTQEILPWICDKYDCKVWARNPAKISNLPKGVALRSLNTQELISDQIVIAAPISGETLTHWCLQRGVSPNTRIFDFRAGGKREDFGFQLHNYQSLEDFFNETQKLASQQQQVRHLSLSMIAEWRLERDHKSQIRPFGWDDL